MLQQVIYSALTDEAIPSSHSLFTTIFTGLPVKTSEMISPLPKDHNNGDNPVSNAVSLHAAGDFYPRKVITVWPCPAWRLPPAV